MKQVSLVVLFLLLLLLIAAPAVPVQASTNVLCAADPPSGPLGTVFVITCTGFDPLTGVFAYTVEPDGAVQVGQVNGIRQQKTDQDGTVSYVFRTQYQNYSQALGTWTLVVDELAPGGAYKYHGEAHFTVTGSTVGVSGATLTVSSSVMVKGEPLEFTGSGFMPGERVDVWVDQPNGGCSSFTYHFTHFGLNLPLFNGESTFSLGHLFADADGKIAFTFGLFSGDCEGAWHLVVRGFSSGAGADVWFNATGNPVTVNALLTASPTAVSPLMDTVTFTGSGFGANEPINCWLTTPQGQVTPVWAGRGTDSTGGFAFSIFTGSYFPGFAIASEGALGTYAMTCKGAMTGNIGVARFDVVGNIVDP